MSGHELAKLGFSSIRELEKRSLPAGLTADVEVVVNTDDDGTQRNKVRSFKVIAADVPADDYRPADLDTERGEVDAGCPGTTGTASTGSRRTREPGDDDDLDDDGFDWRNGDQHTTSAPMLDTAKKGRSSA
jgi:hypothetical protein